MRFCFLIYSPRRFHVEIVSNIIVPASNLPSKFLAFIEGYLAIACSSLPR